MWCARRRQARSRGAVRSVSLAGVVALALISGLVLFGPVVAAQAAVPSGTGGDSFGLDTATTDVGDASLDSGVSASEADFWATHPSILGTDADLNTLNDTLQGLTPGTSDYLQDVASAGAPTPVEADVSDPVGFDVASAGDAAGGSDVVAAVAGEVSVGGAVAGLIGAAGPLALVAGIGFGLHYEWKALGGVGAPAGQDSYTDYAHGGTVNVPPVTIPCGLVSNAGPSECDVPYSGGIQALQGDTFLAEKGFTANDCPVGTNCTAEADVSYTCAANAPTALANPISGGLPGYQEVVGTPAVPDPAPTLVLDTTATTVVGQGSTFSYGINPNYPDSTVYRVLGDPTKCAASTTSSVAALVGWAAPGMTAAAATSAEMERWLSIQQRCYEPGQHVFAYQAARSVPFLATDTAAGQLPRLLCPTDTMTGKPGNIVGVQVYEMPSRTPLLDWKAAPRQLDQNDPYYSCEAGNTTGIPCRVGATDPTQAVTPDSGPNPCRYGGVVVAEADCQLADPMTWTNARTTVRTQPQATPTPQPTVAATTGTGTGTEAEPGGAAATSDDSCFPSGWAVFNPVEWVEKPVGCALSAAFVPSEAEIATDTDSIQTAFDASTLGQATTGVSNVFAGFGSVPAGGCQGPGFDVSQIDAEFADAHATYAPLETCDGLGQQVSDFFRPWLVTGLWLATAFTVYYVVSKSIGAPD